MKPIASAAPRSNPQSGFALLEMLAALAIAVAVMALLAQFTSQALRNWARGERTIATMEMLNSGLGRLRADLALALPIRPPGTDAEGVLFVGESNRIVFVASGSAAGDRGLSLISVTVREDRDGVAVVRERGPIAAAGTQLRDPVILLQGRMRVQFAFRDHNGQAVSAWSRQPQMPKAVTVEISDASGVSVFPVPVVMMLPTNLVAVCLSGDNDSNGVSGGCPNKGRSANQQRDGSETPQRQN